MKVSMLCLGITSLALVMCKAEVEKYNYLHMY
jgi:hypothetical protein